MLKVVLISLMVVAMSACASANLQRKLQGNGPTSIELYRGLAADVDDPAVSVRRVDRLRSTINERVRYEDYTRDAGNEIDQLFPRLPNPRIVIYVFPHLSTSDNAPVPGYATAVNLYEKDEYALPHEIARYSALPESGDAR